MPHWLDKVVSLLQAETADLRELARIAGANPRIFYRGISLDELDVNGQDIEGMEFLSAPHQNVGDQLNLDFYSADDERNPRHKATAIKGARRQEERAARLLAEFLRNRSLATQLLEAYGRDKAILTDTVIDVLRNTLVQEALGKTFSDLQIARKVSGCFSKAEDKRYLVAYYFAKHLPLSPQIARWLQNKSIDKLTKHQREEFERYVLSAYYAE